ncbi:Protein of uncharacterised function (DUF3343) [Aedoeadaptatus ivorii]|uniref:Protein of uncharacterized function (DUF3343) n=1 Tax=Aedoeadaptatus ivorii TaxID=54006 RepID=A0A3S5BWI2_9FIRM|nr:DUF3343 domain-containing protein [Peptoniphilus ivorii]MDQ0508763.1 hypothetical protein [Peptoniphilus ivorii]VEJ36110.1 Protein of uncharacterised function (DUF3343) [Peptoniphilus ivorii]
MQETEWIVTFESITDAMAFEVAAAEEGLTGKIIPLPDVLSAGCGYAWREAAPGEEALKAFLARGAVAYESLIELER